MRSPRPLYSLLGLIVLISACGPTPKKYPPRPAHPLHAGAAIEDLAKTFTLYESVHDYPSAMRTALEMTRREPSNAGYWIAYADAGVYSGADDKALEALTIFEGLGVKKPRLLAQAAKLNFLLGKTARSEKLLKDLGLSTPNHWVGIAEEALTLGSKSLAGQALTKAASLVSDPLSGADRDALMKAGLLSTSMNDISRARGIYAKLTSAPNPSLDVWLVHARLASIAKDSHVAIASLQKARRLAKNVEQKVSIAHLYAGIDRTPLTLKETVALAADLRTLIDEITPEHQRLWITHAEMAAAAKDLNASLVSLGRAQKLGGTLESKREIASLYAAAASNPSAITEPAAVASDFLSLLGELDPKTPHLWIAQAKIAFAAGDPITALASLRRAQKLGTTPGQKTEIERLYDSLSQDPSALKKFKTLPRALTRNLSAVQIRRSADLLAQAGRHAAALPLLKKLARAQPKDTDLLIALARSRAGAGKTRAAAASLKKALASSPSATERHAVGLTYQGLGYHEKAVKILTALKEEDPDNTRYHADLGTSLFLSGSPEAAILEFRTALTLDSSNLAAALSLGSVLTSKGSPAEAVKVYQEALEKNPDAADSPLGRALLKSRKDILTR